MEQDLPGDIGLPKETPKGRFPRLQEKCPLCGCLDTDESMAIKQLIEEKKLMSTMIPMRFNMIPVTGPDGGTSLITIPHLIQMDVTCYDCGVKFRKTAKLKNLMRGRDGKPVMDPR